MKSTFVRVIIVMLVLSLAILPGCSKNKDSETTTEAEITLDNNTTAGQNTIETGLDLSTAVTDTTTEASVTDTVTDAPTALVTEATTAVPVTQAPATEPAGTNYASYTKAQVLNLLTSAVNKTKSYKGDITVHHTESFDLDVNNVTPGGELAKKGVNFVVGLVVKPSEEDYKFSNGTATTSEGEKTQLLLPKAAAFTLPESGVKEAKAQNSAKGLHITLTLNPEECNSLTDVPAYNAASVGYLDLSDSFSIMKITSLNIKYPGSVIDAYINADGYVTTVTYTINMVTHGEASAMGINGSADFTGAQTEIWEIKW